MIRLRSPDPYTLYCYTMVGAIEDMIKCINNGSYVQVAAFLVMTVLFIAFMTWLIGAAIASGVGIVNMFMFATAMELMYGEMNGSILKTC